MKTNSLKMSEIRNLADLTWESEIPAIISSVMEYSFLSSKDIMNMVDTTLSLWTDIPNLVPLMLIYTVIVTSLDLS